MSSLVHSKHQRTNPIRLQAYTWIYHIVHEIYMNIPDYLLHNAVFLYCCPDLPKLPNHGPSNDLATRPIWAVIKKIQIWIRYLMWYNKGQFNIFCILTTQGYIYGQWMLWYSCYDISYGQWMLWYSCYDISYGQWMLWYSCYDISYGQWMLWYSCYDISYGQWMLWYSCYDISYGQWMLWYSCYDISYGQWSYDAAVTISLMVSECCDTAVTISLMASECCDTAVTISLMASECYDTAVTISLMVSESYDTAVTISLIPFYITTYHSWVHCALYCISPFSHIFMACYIDEECLQTPHSVLQKWLVKIISKPLLRRQSKTEVWEKTS